MYRCNVESQRLYRILTAPKRRRVVTELYMFLGSVKAVRPIGGNWYSSILFALRPCIILTARRMCSFIALLYRTKAVYSRYRWVAQALKLTTGFTDQWG